MTKLSRRKTMIGMGLLAAGSGAAFSSAAFQDSVSPNADLRVVVEQNLEIRPGPGFDDDDPLFTDNPDLFDEDNLDDTSGGAFESDDDAPPLAYVDGENENLEVKVAVPLDDTTTFENLFTLENDLDNEVDIGIAYDRNTTPNQYGEDIDANTGTLGVDVAQRAYQFKVNGGSGDPISPNPDPDTFVGGDNGIANDLDKPGTSVNISPGESENLDLVIDTATDSDDIKNAADITPDVFGFQTDTVRLINGFTVGTMTGDNL